LAVEPVPPEGDQEYASGAVPPVATIEAVPAAFPLQGFGVEVAMPEGAPILVMVITAELIQPL
jgi:hypothetical protein